MNYQEIKKEFSKEFFNNNDNDLMAVGLRPLKEKGTYSILLYFRTGETMDNYPDEYKGVSVIKEIIEEAIAF